MFNKKSKLQVAQETTQRSINRLNERIEVLGDRACILHNELIRMQSVFDSIRNLPSEKKLEYEELKKVTSNWKQQAEKIEKEYRKATVKNAGTGVAGAGVGIGVITMGPTVAMGVATTFGVASTGTAISSLSGAAMTNAALAWLGGGALTAGGGGMVAGRALLALAGPVGWTIAGVSLLTSGIVFFKEKADKKRVENVLLSISHRDILTYDLAVVELKERIDRIIDESARLRNAIDRIQTFGRNYKAMSEEQQYELGSYVNIMTSSTQLLVNPIKGIQPKYSSEDLDEFITWRNKIADTDTGNRFKDLIFYLANFLYRIDLDDKDKKLLWIIFRKNKKWLKTMNISKKEFDMDAFNIVFEALEYQQR